MLPRSQNVRDFRNPLERARLAYSRLLPTWPTFPALKGAAGAFLGCPTPLSRRPTQTALTLTLNAGILPGGRSTPSTRFTKCPECPEFFWDFFRFRISEFENLRNARDWRTSDSWPGPLTGPSSTFGGPQGQGGLIPRVVVKECGL